MLCLFTPTEWRIDVERRLYDIIGRNWGEKVEEEEYNGMGPFSAPAAAAMAAAAPVPLPASGGWGQAPSGLTSSSSSSPAAAAIEVPSVAGVSLGVMEEEEGYGMGLLPASVGWSHAHAGSNSSSISSSPAAAAAAATASPALEEKQPSLEILRAELRSRMRRPRTERRRVARPASSSVPRAPVEAIAHEDRQENPFPVRLDDGMGDDGTGSHIDRETKEIFGPDIQRIMRYKLLHPEKSNIVIASELGLPRQAVAQVLS